MIQNYRTVMKFWDLLIPFVLIFILGCNSINKNEKTEPTFISIKCNKYELAPNGKYRYSFLIKNYDPIKSVFNGTIDISIISKEGKPIRYDTFELIDFKSGENKIFNLEAMTGVVSVHGDAGIEKYGYSIKSVPETNTKEGFNLIEQYKLDDNYNLLDEYK